jgi:hypothetical protein
VNDIEFDPGVVRLRKILYKQDEVPEENDEENE